MTVDWTKPIEFEDEDERAKFSVEVAAHLDNPIPYEPQYCLRFTNRETGGQSFGTANSDGMASCNLRIRNSRETWEAWLVFYFFEGSIRAWMATTEREARNYADNRQVVLAIKQVTVTEGEGIGDGCS